MSMRYAKIINKSEWVQSVKIETLNNTVPMVAAAAWRYDTCSDLNKSAVDTIVEEEDVG